MKMKIIGINFYDALENCFKVYNIEKKRKFNTKNVTLLLETEALHLIVIIIFSHHLKLVKNYCK